MKILLIGLLISTCNCYAGVLPADFHFRAPSNERVSFVTQFKEYEEEKAEHENCVELSEQEQNFQKSDQHELSFFEKCKNFIMELIALFSMKRE
jgi:hypothetical protein